MKTPCRCLFQNGKNKKRNKDARDLTVRKAGAPGSKFDKMAGISSIV